MEQCYLKALTKGFVENKGQSSPLSVDSKTQGKCQLSVKIVAICQLSVNPIHTLISGKLGELKMQIKFNSLCLQSDDGYSKKNKENYPRECF